MPLPHCRAAATRCGTARPSGYVATITGSASEQSFPKHERIAKRREFVRIYEQGRKQRSRFFVLFAARNELGHPRLGITVTRKLGKAHDRNRLKRWVRETWRRRRTALGLEKQSLDVVLNVKAAAREAAFSEFAEDLELALRRVLNEETRAR
jgi:ribonuclease P protein component